MTYMRFAMSDCDIAGHIVPPNVLPVAQKLHSTAA
jgi:hypothetical protein